MRTALPHGSELKSIRLRGFLRPGKKRSKKMINERIAAYKMLRYTPGRIPPIGANDTISFFLEIGSPFLLFEDMSELYNEQVTISNEQNRAVCNMPLPTFVLHDNFVVMANTQKRDFFDQVQFFTESYLTKRRERREEKKAKHERKLAKYREKINKRIKNPALQVIILTIVDWVDAFLWAAGVVLLINQYLFQLYQIPSGSMIDTLLIQDRVFVNKIIYGPELLPGTLKVPSPIKPERNEIIIFENPSYISRGVGFDVLQRIIFMLTLSLVDIDKDENGMPKPHFLIKRAVGVGGDRFINKNGNLSMKFEGETRWVAESDFNRGRGYSHNVSRLLNDEDYRAINAAGKAIAYNELRLNPPETIVTDAMAANNIDYPDYLAYSESRLELLAAASPDDERFSSLLAQSRMGWYIPEGRMLPLGDNRDNSRDGRYFGPVRQDKILGQAAVKFNTIEGLKLINKE
jgi:signal peptidase I